MGFDPLMYIGPERPLTAAHVNRRFPEQTLTAKRRDTVRTGHDNRIHGARNHARRRRRTLTHRGGSMMRTWPTGEAAVFQTVPGEFDSRRPLDARAVQRRLDDVSGVVQQVGRWPLDSAIKVATPCT